MICKVKGDKRFYKWICVVNRNRDIIIRLNCLAYKVIFLTNMLDELPIGEKNFNPSYLQVKVANIRIVFNLSVDVIFTNIYSKILCSTIFVTNLARVNSTTMTDKTQLIELSCHINNLILCLNINN